MCFKNRFCLSIWVLPCANRQPITPSRCILLHGMIFFIESNLTPKQVGFVACSGPAEWGCQVLTPLGGILIAVLHSGEMSADVTARCCGHLLVLHPDASAESRLMSSLALNCRAACTEPFWEPAEGQAGMLTGEGMGSLCPHLFRLASISSRCDQNSKQHPTCTGWRSCTSVLVYMQ